MDVAVQLFGVWPLEQSLTALASKVTPVAPTVSFVKRFFVCATPVAPDEVSAAAVEAGGLCTVDEMVPAPT
jgi:hypothetical protein